MKTLTKKLLSIVLCGIMLLGMISVGGSGFSKLLYGLTANASSASYQAGDIIEFGHYPQASLTDSYIRARLAEQEADSLGRIYYNGKLYFKEGSTGYYTYDPIEWRVLSVDSDGVYVIAEKLLDAKPYNTSNVSITWADCTLRTWLNGTFSDLAFTEDESNLINSTHLVNGDNPNYGTEGGVSTDDNIFVLSLADSLDSNYGFSSTTSSDTARKAKYSDYAAARGIYTGANPYSWWWLRTPGSYTDGACYVSYDGSISYYNYVINTNVGVRPALKLNLESGISQSASEYTLKIIDEETGAPVSGVNASAAGVSYTGSAAGILKFAVKSAVTNAKVTLSKTGFSSKTVNVSELSKDKINTVTMSSKDPFNAGALIENIDLGDTNIKGPTADILGHEVTLFDVDLGLNLDLGKFNFKTDYDKKTQTYKVILGVKDGVEVNNHDKFMEKYEDFKDFFGITNAASDQMTNYKCRQAYKKIQDDLETQKGLAGVEADLKVAGFMNFDVSTGDLVPIESGITVTGDVEYSQEFPFWYVFYATFKLGAEAGFTMQYDLTNTGSFVSGYNALIEFALKAGLGLGAKAFSKKIASVEAGLEGKLKTTFALPSESLSKSMTVKLEGDAYVKGNLWKLSAKKEWEFGDGLQLYPQTKSARSKASAASANDYSIDEADFMLTSRDYLDYRSSNTSKLKMAKSISETFTKKAVYPYGFPKTALIGDKLVAVWVEDDGTKTDANSNTLYYTVNNGTSWSSPAAVYESGKADFEADIYSDGTNVYAVWQRASKVFDNDVQISDYAENTEIVYSMFDGSSWSKPVVVGNSSVLSTNYVVTANGSDVVVAFSQNSAYDYSGDTGVNSVYTQTLSAGEWSTPVLVKTDLAMVDSLCTGTVNSAVKTLYSAGGEIYDGATALTDDEIDDSSVTFQNGSFYWLGGGKLMSYTSAVNSLGISAQDDYRIISNGTKTSLLTTVDDGYTNEIYVSNLESGAFSTPLALTNYGKHISSFDAVMNDDGTITTACDVENLSTEQGAYPYTTTDMIIDRLDETVNLSVESSAYYDAQSIVPSGKVTFTAELSNIGTADAESYVVKLIDKSGTELASKTISDALISGGKTEISIDYTLPQTISRTTVSLVVEAENDIDTADNTAAAEYGYADIALVNCKVGSDGKITGQVVNNGYDTAQSVKVAVNKFNETIENLTYIEIGSLAPSETREISYTVPQSEIVFSQDIQRILLTLNVTSSSDELSLANNSAELALNPTAATGVTLNKTSLTLSVGDKYTLFADVAPIDAFNKNIEWMSDYTAYASVDDNGQVTANGIGEATITVVTEDGEFVAQCKVTVVEKAETTAVTGIEINQTQLNVTVGKTAQLSATISPENATNSEVIWTSGDESIAQVTQSGLVIALKSGKTEITASSADGGFKKVCAVSVEPLYYTVTWVTEGKKTTQELKEGETITKPADPTKEGYAFTGWTPSVPSTMPANDLEFTAVFKSNTYKATYIVDGVQYAQYIVDFGSTVTKPADPTKAGYTFTGWTPSVPSTMPANDLEFTAVFKSNTYKATYIVDGVQYAQYIVDFGSTVTKPADPTKAGYTFTGWTPSVPSTMPANDLEFTAVFAPIAVTNPTASAVINATGASVDYRTKTTFTATATGVPDGYYLAIYDGTNQLAKGSNTSVTYNLGELKNSKNLTVKIIDASGNVQKDSVGSELKKDVTISVNSGFWQKIVAFFKSLFGSLPTKEIKA